MHICNQCRERISADQPDHSRGFPAFTIMGGLIGVLGAASTGALLLVPATVFAGMLADTRRCDVCGEESHQDDQGYRLMEELAGELGGRSYRPAVPSSQAGRPQQESPHVAPRLTPGQWESRHSDERRDRFDDGSREDDSQHQKTFVYDEVEGKLVPEDTRTTEPELGLDRSLALDGGMDPGFLPSMPSPFDDTFADDLLDSGQTEIDTGRDLDLPEEPPLEELLP